MSNTIKVVTTSGSGGGYARPGYINVVEMLPDTAFMNVRAKNVVALHSRVPVNLRSTGPRSAYGQALAAAEKLAAQLTAAAVQVAA